MTAQLGARAQPSGRMIEVGPSHAKPLEVAADICGAGQALEASLALLKAELRSAATEAVFLRVRSKPNLWLSGLAELNVARTTSSAKRLH